MKVQLVNLYRVSHLQRFGVTARGNVTSVYPPFLVCFMRTTHPAHRILIITAEEYKLLSLSLHTASSLPLYQTASLHPPEHVVTAAFL